MALAEGASEGNERCRDVSQGQSNQSNQTSGGQMKRDRKLEVGGKNEIGATAVGVAKRSSVTPTCHQKTEHRGLVLTDKNLG